MAELGAELGGSGVGGAPGLGLGLKGPVQSRGVVLTGFLEVIFNERHEL